MQCGRLDIEYGVIKAINAFGRAAKEIYCEGCDDWHTIWRPATAADVLGVEILPLPDEPPF